MNTNSIRIESHLKDLKIALLHMPPKTSVGNMPVLLLHGATFPAALSFDFQMNGSSWMDYLSDHNMESYALDFLGYGDADRYPEMSHEQGLPIGRAMSAYLDVDKAIDYILQQTGHRQLILIGHSWGASVAALYAENFPNKLAKLVLFAPITVSADAVDNPITIERSYESLTPDQRVQAMVDLTPEGEMHQLEPELFTQWKADWLQSDITTKKTDSGAVHFPAGPSQDIADLSQGKSYYNPAKILVPTLVIRGEWDDYPNNNDALQLMASLPDETIKKYVVVPRGTHVMHLEKSRHQLYAETLKFIDTPVQEERSSNIAVIFEVIPHEGRLQDYLDIAAQLKSTLENVAGFVSIERFQSLSHPEKILSLSFWKDEQSIFTWRNLELHRDAQQKGRNSIFKDYHLRIAHVVRDYGMFERREAPKDSQMYHGRTY
ncbi:MAG: alpha/beta fold hydrolase [Chitinophaga sp.]|uniref:alpha/beta fold hydrolase n=1 Tax=Chitinophaga sp. TaxID=1869181 RepID=UPI0025BE3B57|nr:alpha/beta fold hydrolase [Chitinophaga sp.]MBV8253532.1 alpha/beta fold hydrolase [Chitinophaga sp.]